MWQKLTYHSLLHHFVFFLRKLEIWRGLKLKKYVYIVLIERITSLIRKSKSGILLLKIIQILSVSTAIFSDLLFLREKKCIYLHTYIQLLTIFYCYQYRNLQSPIFSVLNFSVPQKNAPSLTSAIFGHKDLHIF